MDRKNDEIFSPIKNSDEEKKNRLSDSFSKFLKGPDVFRKNSKTELQFDSDESSLQSGASVISKEIKTTCPSLSSHYKILLELHAIKSSVQSEASGSKRNERICGPSSLTQHNLLSQGNINEKALSIISISSKTLQDKTTKSQGKKAETSPLILNDTLFNHLESSCSLKNVEADNLQSGSTKKNKYFSDTSLAAVYDKKTEDQHGEAECKIGRKHTSNTNMLHSRSIKKSLQATSAIVSKAIKNIKDSTLLNQCNPSSQLYPVESSVHSRAVVASEVSGSKEIKKTYSQSTASQRNPLSQIQSTIEKIVSDAVESQVDNLQQLMWSHHCSLLKFLDETKETLENKHVSERETLCKIMEEIAEENRLLRGAASGH